MNIDYEDISNTLRRISLAGRMDIEGADQIANKFAALSATTERHVIVDLTGVSFLASIGIRLLISNAKALQQRGGRMVLLVSVGDAVERTLETTGVDSLIPMFSDYASALAAVDV